MVEPEEHPLQINLEILVKPELLDKQDLLVQQDQLETQGNPLLD
jgi:hypothetical protein